MLIISLFFLGLAIILAVFLLPLTLRAQSRSGVQLLDLTPSYKSTAAGFGFFLVLNLAIGLALGFLSNMVAALAMLIVMAVKFVGRHALTEKGVLSGPRIYPWETIQSWAWQPKSSWRPQMLLLSIRGGDSHSRQKGIPVKAGIEELADTILRQKVSVTGDLRTGARTTAKQSINDPKGE